MAAMLVPWRRSGASRPPLMPLPSFTTPSTTYWRPKTASGVPPANMEDLPFDVFEFMEYELPWEMRSDPDLGR